jgi:hypothetical protein
VNEYITELLYEIRIISNLYNNSNSEDAKEKYLSCVENILDNCNGLEKEVLQSIWEELKNE